MKILEIIEDSINQRHIDEIVNILENGGLIIYPTDTAYALGCDALNNSAIERICSLKAMKSAKTNLSIICSDLSQVTQYAKVDNTQFRVMKRNLPGPFTFLLPALSRLPKAFKGRRTVGIRIPDNRVAHAIVESLGRPILTTTVPDTLNDDYRCEPELLAEAFRATVDIVVDGGRGNLDQSTVVDCTDDFEIIRQGKGILN